MDLNYIVTVVKNYLGWTEDEEGQGLVEYGLIIVLVSIVVFATLQTLGTTLDSVFSNINTKLNP